MADPRLLRRLDQVAGRLRRLRLLKMQSLGWGLLAIMLIALLAARAPSLLRQTLLCGVPLVLAAGWLAGRARRSDRQQAAVLIEQIYPELDSRLLTAMQQRPHDRSWDFTFLQTELLAEVFSQLRQQNWQRAVASRRLWGAHALRAAALGLCVALTLGLLEGDPVTRGGFLAGPPKPADAATPWKVSVEPGNVDLERGSSLLVLAKFPDRLPGAVELVATDAQGKEVRVPLQKSLEDPLYGGRIPAVERDLSYHVEFEGQRSADFKATTFEYPALVKADAEVKFPEYTGLDPKTIADVRRVSVVEGSTLELKCQLNKPVRSAVLVDGENHEVKLASAVADSPLQCVQLPAAAPGEQRYKLHLIDEQGRANREPTEFRVTVLPNRPPELKITFPSKDLRVSTLQELSLKAEASDDFGLKELGLVYQTPDGAQETVPFGKTAPKDEKARAEHLLAMETLKTKPDDLVSYYFYAEDVGPDGQPRRSFSDIFFAEVRPFEEIYKQKPSEKGEGENECQKLIELQRAVVSASWNVMRREPADPPRPGFQPEVKTLTDSQQKIRSLTESYRSKLDDALLKQYAEEAIQHMRLAAEKFEKSKAKPTIAPLPEGRAEAQEAYQALLKLQSRIKQVQQAQAGKGKPRSGSKQLDQQLNALKLKNDRDRYETERQAKAEQDAAAKEALQVLNRLKELARRQEDLNQRIRELESALREAKTDEERAEIDRRLKRLQEEQQELLRNLDELRERMNSERNRDRMADARQDAEEVRDKVLRASQALQQGQTSKALNEGTRAERQLQQLEEKLRAQTATQFADAMRELREDVRELAEKEQSLAQQLPGNKSERPSGRPSLRDDEPATPSGDLNKQFEEQQERLTQALDKTKQLVDESEVSEPLLSKKLYDALREIRKYEPEAALENAGRMAKAGIASEARKLEEQARTGIDKLQAGIEEAARGILGNEEEALRQAQSELKRLTESIREELALNDPKSAGQQSGQQPNPPDSSADSKSAPGGPKPGEQPGQPQGQQPGQQSGEQAGQQSGQQSGQQPGQQAGQQPGQAQSPQGQSSQGHGQGRSPSQSGQQPGQSPGQQSGQQSGEQGESGQSPGQSPGQRPGQQPGQQRGRQPGQGRSSGSQGQGQLTEDAQPRENLVDQLGQMLSPSGGDGSGAAGPHLPLSGGSFLEWSDRMRDVEEMLSTPQLRGQAAMIRDRARQERIDVKRHSKEPNWELVRASIYGPLLELQQQVAEELARRDPDKKLVPIDRDPAPDQYADLVRDYFKELSRAGERSPH